MIFLYCLDMIDLKSSLGQLLLVLGFAVLVFVVMVVMLEDTSPMTTRFFDGTLVGGNTQVFYQDPRVKNAKTIHRSMNEKGGIEFTYDWWMMVNQYPSNEQSIVFVKGDPGFNNKVSKVYSPAVVLQNKDGGNEMNIMFNTYATEDEIVVIKNMPIATWVHCAIVVKNKTAYVYINGKLARSQKIAGVIRQNYGNLVVGPNRGFSGMISNLTYNRRALTPSEIANISAGSPNKRIIGISVDQPPYISKAWYLGGGNVDYIST